jgi:transposase
MFKSLTDDQWQLLAPHFPKPFKRGRGKPHAPWRNVLNSILYILHTGSKWDALPKREENPDFAPKSVAHRWFLRWEKEGFLMQLIAALGVEANLAATVAGLPRRKRGAKQQPVELSLTA